MEEDCECDLNLQRFKKVTTVKSQHILYQNFIFSETLKAFGRSIRHKKLIILLLKTDISVYRKHEKIDQNNFANLKEEMRCGKCDTWLRSSRGDVDASLICSRYQIYLQ